MDGLEPRQHAIKGLRFLGPGAEPKPRNTDPNVAMNVHGGEKITFRSSELDIVGVDDWPLEHARSIPWVVEDWKRRNERFAPHLAWLKELGVHSAYTALSWSCKDVHLEGDKLKNFAEWH